MPETAAATGRRGAEKREIDDGKSQDQKRARLQPEASQRRKRGPKIETDDLRADGPGDTEVDTMDW